MSDQERFDRYNKARADIEDAVMRIRDITEIHQININYLFDPEAGHSYARAMLLGDSSGALFTKELRGF